MDKNLAYYISGHGYGHYARSLPVLKHLAPKFNLHIKTEVPEFLFKPYLDAHHWLQPVDVGCRHANSLNIDAEKTFKEFNIFQSNARVEAEKNWMREKSDRFGSI